jgi:hypothetical protein
MPRAEGSFMPQSTTPELKICEKTMHSDDYRSSLPDGAVMDPGKAGAIVAMSSKERLSEITRALEGLGLLVAGCATREELAVLLVSSIERPEVSIPEVVVIDAALLETAELVDLLQRAGCLDSMIVILPEQWPRGVTPAQLEPSQVLQAPFPMTVLVEEVARRMTPLSVRHDAARLG